VADAAKQLGVSLNFLYERIRSNEIPTVNLGTDTQKKLRIRDDSLRAFVEARTTRIAA
jgi:excisionase family DNA binding protein